MKIKSFTFLLLAVSALASACRKSAENTVPVSSREIVFGLSGDLSTKGAAVVTGANLGSFYVSALDDNGYAFQNACFTQEGVDIWKGGQYWPVTNPHYRFAASNVCLVTGSAQPSVSADVGTDVVVAYLADPTYNAVNALTFRHVFAQVGTASMKAPDGYTVTDLKLWLTPRTSGIYLLDTDTWTDVNLAAADAYLIGSAESGVNLEEGGTHTSPDNDLWLVPGTYMLHAGYTIAKGAYTNTKSATASVTFSQGYNHHIGLNNGAANIPEPGDITELSFTVTVAEWQSKTLTPSFQ